MADAASIEAASTARPAAAVLVVDDNAAKRLAVRAMLAPLGHSVVEADSGRAALRAVLRAELRGDPDGRADADAGRLRDGQADPAAQPVGAHADHLPHRLRTRRDRDGHAHMPAAPSTSSSRRSSPTCCAPRSRPSSTCSCSPRSCSARSSRSRSLNAALRDSEVRARAVLQNVADGIVTAGEGGCIESFNRSARRLFGYREEEVIGQPLQLIVAPSHHDGFTDAARARWSLLTAKDIPAEPTETVGCRKDGSCFPIEIGMSQMQIGERTFTIGCIRDISGRKAYTEALERRTLHDELTGLPNRALFGDRLDLAIASADRDQRAARRAARRPRRVPRGQRRRWDATTATPCSGRSPSGSAARCATRTPWPAWAATSSASCRRAPPTWRRPRASPGRSARRSRTRSSSAARSSTSGPASASPSSPARQRDRRPAASRRAGHAGGQADRQRPRGLRRRAGGSERAPADAPERAARRHPARRARPALPAAGRPGDTADHRGRGAGPLAAPHRGAPDAGAVHARGGAQRADRALDALGARRRPCTSSACGPMPASS